MGRPPNAQRKIFPFFKLPAEVRNKIYCYSLDVQKAKDAPTDLSQPPFPDELSRKEFIAQGSAHLNYSFDTAVLAVCRQMQHEATALIKERLMLFIDIERPGGDVWQEPSGVERAMRPRGLPLPLQQIVPYAATIPLRDLRVRMVVKTWMAEDRGLWEPLYRKRIHQIVGTLKRFVALETITIEFCQVSRERVDFYEPFSLCRERILQCFEGFRGFKEVTIRGEIKTSRATALKELMQRPRPPAEGDDQVFERKCFCKR
ncbi:MAG: hypothetical protein LQ346_000751 [Caloplaca aetnensis]|nr:MAG: hypothetical protein LQ346_000751 [Caloplaca aetnensis]